MITWHLMENLNEVREITHEDVGVVVYRIMAPRDVHILIPGICEYGASHGKKEIVDVIK